MSEKLFRGKSAKKIALVLAVALALTCLPGMLAGALPPPETLSAHGVGPRGEYKVSHHPDPPNGVYVSPGGNDSTATGSIGAPYRSINAALNAAPAGSTIILRGGTYQEHNNVRIQQPNVTVKSAYGEWAVIDFPLAHDPDTWRQTSAVRFDVNSSGGKLQSVEVVGGFYAVCLETKWDWGQPDRSGASNIIIEDCIIRDSRNDVVKVKPNCDDVTIRYNEIYNSGREHVNHPDFTTGERNAEGIDNVNGDRMHVHNNYIHDICSNAIYAKGGAIDALIENNWIENAYGAGIMVGFDTSPEYFDLTVNPKYYENIGGVVRNNLIINTGWEGIGLYASKDAQVYNNTVVGAVTYGTGKYHSPIYFGVANQ
ncbi:MAG: right-handed parallel beta-helix repeat-containing protein, partial [Oscillospiraceae bacterium]|nr:right-handed parallel beta-helix repeat-containing protein [Oscillospiraceae bacterium]